jgi:hypothetical protein
MKKQYPTREKDRWEHALTRPLRGISFETLELMRMDLFELLDVLTTSPYTDQKSMRHLARDLRRVTVRLMELTSYRARALYGARKAGRIEVSIETGDGPPPSPQPIAWDAQRFWERAQR